jgi:hypothetical protein
MRILRHTLSASLLSVLVLSGCAKDASDDGGDDTSTPVVVDEDQDGASAEDDCDDTDASLNLDDGDSDGFSTCDGDCNDFDAGVYPGAGDTYGDGADQNCDGTDGVDTDGDGWASEASGGADCDDSEATTYPGADEYCDGHDDNCDGETDEDTSVDVSTWYTDADSDGYGDAASADIDCYQPTGYVADATDCDDSEATTYPGADEYCDGHDDNCDGDIDEDTSVDVSTWYADTDSDGYGDAASTDIECYTPTNYVMDATDCDDSDITTNPGADEYCDGHDDNCDGDIDEDTSVDVSTWYADTDSDGYGDAASTDIDCYQPTGYVPDDADCDDSDPDSNLDVDNDGYSTCDDDCDDTDATRYPFAGDIYGDGVDLDCDGFDCSSGEDTNGVYFSICPDLAGSYSGADTACQTDIDSDGIAEIQDATEQLFVEGLISAGSHSGDFWIQYPSSNGYTNWGPGQPDGGPCAVIRTSYGNGWNDFGCSGSNTPVCVQR